MGIGRNDESDDIYYGYCRLRLLELKEVFYDMSKAFLEISYEDTSACQKDNIINDEADIARLTWLEKINDMKLSIALQMEGAGMLIEKILREMANIKRADSHTEREMSLQMKGIRIQMSSLLETEYDGIEKIIMDVRTKKGKLVSSKEIAGIAGEIYAIPMAVSRECKSMVNDKWTRLVLMPRSVFKMLFSYEGCKSDSQLVSGDNYAYFGDEIRNYMILSDGMGKGFMAGKESEEAVELIQKLIEAGFSKELAVSMANSLITAKTNDSDFTTIDICETDMFTGMCEFIKMGAAPSFIRRQSMVEIICSSSLPAGVKAQAQMQKVSKKLGDGDFIIMISDGISDAFGEKSEELISELILNYTGNNPMELSKYILSEALNASNGIKADDMSVMVSGMWYR